ncbi:TetR/AcrR family transcriptional regulator [Georgenia thermotolerans]|nr:TetR/AcrR family transcriptional regulator [Georgenia thermotolerans]
MRSDAQQNRLRLVRATRDLVGWADSPDVTVRDIAKTAGVSLATLYRHFDGRQALIDEVSILRWNRMAELSGQRRPDEEPVDHVLRILETYTRMTTRDHRFIRGAGIEVGTTPVEHIRAAFEPRFATSWVAAQSAGQIRRTADPRDAIDMAGMIRDSQRRVPMLAMLAGGICTDKVDVGAFAARAVSRHWK